MRASPPARARYSAVSFPTKPVAPYNTMSNSRGVPVTGPTLLRRNEAKFTYMARIVVIGAGIAGLATAVALQRRDHQVSVLERRSDTSTAPPSVSGPTRWRRWTSSAWVMRSARPVAALRAARCAGATARGCAIPQAKP